jgi:hypothetical protein
MQEESIYNTYTERFIERTREFTRLGKYLNRKLKDASFS